MSQYTPEERTAILAEARAALEPTAGERTDVADHAGAEAWPARGPLIPVRSTAAMDRWRAEQVALESERKDARERQQADDERQRERAVNKKMRNDDGWNQWAIGLIRRELAEHDDSVAEAVAKFTVDEIDKVRAELLAAIGELRAEFAVARAHDDGSVIDLPMLPRRHDAAY